MLGVMGVNRAVQAGDFIQSAAAQIVFVGPPKLYHEVARNTFDRFLKGCSTFTAEDRRQCNLPKELEEKFCPGTSRIYLRTGDIWLVLAFKIINRHVYLKQWTASR